MDDVDAHLARGGSAPLPAAEMAELNRLLADPAVWAEAGFDLADRVVDAVAAAAPAVPPAASPPIPTRIGASTTRRRSRRIPYSIAAVAASVAVALGLTIGLSADHQHTPPRYAVALRGTALAPAAAGHAVLTRTSSGWAIYLDARGLARRADGTCYEAWLKNSDGELVPVGTFNEADDVRLWAGAAPTAYPILTVTRQRIGEVSSSGQVVLTGRAVPAS
jgi:Anti-sigma-K factor rskA